MVRGERGCRVGGPSGAAIGVRREPDYGLPDGGPITPLSAGTLATSPCTRTLASPQATVCLAPQAGPGGGCPGHREVTGHAAAMTDPLSRRCRVTRRRKDAFGRATYHKRTSRMRQESRQDVARGTG
jgi:hypothetical protein